MRLIASLALLSLVTAPAHASWQVLRAQDGLASDAVTAIHEDGRGALWFGTTRGVTRYNGVSWNTWHMAEGLPTDSVRGVASDGQGDVWVATSAGVARYDGSNWKTFTRLDGLASDDVRSVLVDRAGSLWFGTAAGITRLRQGTWTTFDDELPGGARLIGDILEDRAGAVWFATGIGALRYDGSSWKVIPTANGPAGTPRLSGTLVYSLAEDTAGSIWIGTDASLERFDGTDLLSFGPASVEGGAQHVLVDRQDLVWFAGNTLSRSDARLAGSGFTGAIQIFDPPDGPPHGSAPGPCGTCLHASSVLQDETGNIWIGTNEGAARFDGGRVKALTSLEGAPDRSFQTVLEDTRGGIWAGGRDGMWHRDSTGWHPVPEVHGNAVRILEDRHRDVWVATVAGNVDDGGLFQWSSASATWTDHSPSAGIGASGARSVMEDAAGEIWAAGEGVARFDGSSWRKFIALDGLASDDAYSLGSDGAADVWVGTAEGASRFDGTAWRNFTTGDGLANGPITSIATDRSGAVWLASAFGANRYDGTTWSRFTAGDALQDGSVSAIAVDSAGAVWLGCQTGIERFASGGWRFFSSADGLPGDPGINTLHVDGRGELWAALRKGLARFDGTGWRVQTTIDGLSSDVVFDIAENPRGHLWLATDFRITTLEPDRVPPQTAILAGPPSPSTSRSLTIPFQAAFGEQAGVQFSYAIDGGPWSPWSPAGQWSGFGIEDGLHLFRVRAEDSEGNVDPSPAETRFEIDASPPVPRITSPAQDDAVQGSVVVIGTADDPRFGSYRLEYRPTGAGTWSLVASSETPVVAGTLGTWPTKDLAEGWYDLRLSVRDTLGLTGQVLVSIEVDNQDPRSAQTTPARVRAVDGGDVYTTHREAHVYFPPRALTDDAVVTIDAADSSQIPPSLPDGSVPVGPAYLLSLGIATLDKPATLEMADGGSGGTAIYYKTSGSEWQHLGGTSREGRISGAIGAPGLYALFRGGSPPVSGAGLSVLGVTPRVLARSGSFATTRIAISFTLGRPATCTIKVFNRAGRMVRRVGELSGGSGENLAYWDGRGDGGLEVHDGFYVVSVEALGSCQTAVVAVVH